MTQEEKELLLSDILGRLQYEVKAHYKYYDFVGETEQLVSEDDAVIIGINTTLGNPIQIDGYYIEIEYVKPYLRPMSSMSEEEHDEYIMIEYSINAGMTSKRDFTKWIDFVHSNHFDYRGLISMDLALPAPEGMYN